MEQRVKNILVGSLLGDGWLSALRPRTKTSIYYLKYSDASIDYLRWIREQITELKPSLLKATPHYQQHYLYTPARTDIGEFRALFYPNEGKKRVPANINELLRDPLTLAIWYQDDGTLDRRSKYHWNAMFATYCFPHEDCTRLANAMAENFGIEASVCRCLMRGKLYYRLYIPSKSMERFVETVRPYIHPAFSYKISHEGGQQQR